MTTHPTFPSHRVPLRTMLVAVSVLSLLLVACGRDRSGSNCTPGATVPCVGAGGATGTRSCNATGMYGSCEVGMTGSDGGMTTGDGGAGSDGSVMTTDGGTTGTDGGSVTGACTDVDLTTLEDGYNSCLGECAFVSDYTTCYSSCFASFASSAPPACVGCYESRAGCTNSQCVNLEACDPFSASGCRACECGDNSDGVDCVAPFVVCSGLTSASCGGG